MQLLTNRRQRAVQGAVSVDAIVAQIGGSADELVKRYGAVAEDFMGRPMIAFADAKAAYDAFLVADHQRDVVRSAYEAYVDDRKRRRTELRDRVWAERVAQLPQALGAPRIFMACQVAVSEAWARFDELEPELTITQFREAHQ